jgi:hypothetical protein
VIGAVVLISQARACAFGGNPENPWGKFRRNAWVILPGQLVTHRRVGAALEGVIKKLQIFMEHGFRQASCRGGKIRTPLAVAAGRVHMREPTSPPAKVFIDAIVVGMQGLEANQIMHDEISGLRITQNRCLWPSKMSMVMPFARRVGQHFLKWAPTRRFEIFPGGNQTVERIANRGKDEVILLKSRTFRPGRSQHAISRLYRS